MGSIGFVASANNYAGVIDLNTWSQAGPSANGIWTVAPGGGSVFQSINGEPTLFLSPDDDFHGTIMGDIAVETTSDDDYIGFVFGFQDLNDFYLFDWKQGIQSGSSPGFVLSHVTGGLGSIPFGDHDNPTPPIPGYEVLATDLGEGWRDNTVYTFTIGYNSGSIVASVEGGQFSSPTNVISASGSFESGQYGFFNHSQTDVRYSAFEESVAPPVDGGGEVPEPTSLAIFGILGLIGCRRRRMKMS